MQSRDRLTNDHRRLLGVAIAMANADGVIDEQEMELIELLTNQLGLEGEARDEVLEMMHSPPGLEDIARWSVTDQDRLNIYTVALSMAEVDGHVAPEELVMLEQLAILLGLPSEGIEAPMKEESR